MLQVRTPFLSSDRVKLILCLDGHDRVDQAQHTRGSRHLH
jgi:hypothetical protein